MVLFQFVFLVYLSFVRCCLHESTSIVLGIVPEWRNTFCRWQNHCSTRCRKQTEYTYKSLLCLIFFSLYHSLCRLHSWLVNCLWKVANASQIPTAHGLRSHSFVDHFFFCCVSIFVCSLVMVMLLSSGCPVAEVISIYSLTCNNFSSILHFFYTFVCLFVCVSVVEVRNRYGRHIYSVPFSVLDIFRILPISQLCSTDNCYDLLHKRCVSAWHWMIREHASSCGTAIIAHNCYYVYTYDIVTRGGAAPRAPYRVVRNESVATSYLLQWSVLFFWARNRKASKQRLQTVLEMTGTSSQPIWISCHQQHQIHAALP